jgi:peptidoglycan DL-endopeptidase CwlO
VRTRLSHPIWLFLVTGLAVVFLCVSALTASAVPTTAAIRSKRKQADAAERKLQDLGAELEVRGEELAQIEDALLQTRAQISATEYDLQKANEDLTRSQALLDRRIGSIYRNGPVSVVSMLVGANDFLDLISRIDLMRRIGDSDAAVVASVKEAKGRVEASQRSLEAKQAEQLALRSESRDKQEQVATASAEQQRYVKTLTSELKRLIVKETKRLEAIAAKRKAEAEARARAISLRNKGTRPFTGVLGTPHPEVVPIAARYIGVPYVWGGTTPAGFDCSGLTQYCYRQIGIYLPRTSSVQFHSGTYIPPDRLDLLKPGDLVFFGTGGDPGKIHHVGLYVGGGSMIHAPYTGARVCRASLIARINSRGDYVGACRP